NLHRHNMTWNARSKCNLARSSYCAIFRHKERSPARHSCDCTEKASTARVLRMGSHLHTRCHPRKLPRLRDDRVICAESKLKNWHSSANNTALHNLSPLTRQVYDAQPGPRERPVRNNTSRIR